MKKRKLMALITAGVLLLGIVQPQEAMAWIPGTDSEQQEQSQQPIPIHTHETVQLDIGANMTTIATSSASSFAIQPDGSLWAWGPNWHGQLGDGTTIERHRPVRVMENVIAISAGGSEDPNFTTGGAANAESHTMAITSDGVLWGWGSNRHGQLGDGTTIDRHSPVRIMDNVVSVSANSRKTAAVRTDGSLWVWGVTPIRSGTPRYSFCPVNLFFMAEVQNVKQSSPIKVMDDVVYASVGVGNLNLLAIRTDGSLWGWEAMRDDPVIENPSPIPIPPAILPYGWGVIELRGEAVPTDFDIEEIFAALGRGEIPTGFEQQIIEPSELGEFGIVVAHWKVTPVKIMNNVVAVSNTWHTMAIRADGSLWGWGRNVQGEIGNGTAGDWNEPMINGVRASDVVAPTRIKDNVVAVSARRGYTMAIRDDGSLWAWGCNFYGQFGDGTTTGQLNPTRIMDDVVSISSGRGIHTLAIRTDGSLWAWGHNRYGQLGDGTTENRQNPVRVMGNAMMPVITPMNTVFDSSIPPMIFFTEQRQQEAEQREQLRQQETEQRLQEDEQRERPRQQEATTREISRLEETYQSWIEHERNLRAVLANQIREFSHLPPESQRAIRDAHEETLARSAQRSEAERARIRQQITELRSRNQN